MSASSWSADQGAPDDGAGGREDDVRGGREDFEQPLELEEVPKPIAGPGEVVVRVEASGLCHTDIHAAHGDWPVKPTPPFTPGHEGVGIVEQIGPG